MTVSVPQGTDLSIRVENGYATQGPLIFGLYRWRGVWRAERNSPVYETRWFLTRRAMVRWFQGSINRRASS